VPATERTQLGVRRRISAAGHRRAGLDRRLPGKHGAVAGARRGDDLRVEPVIAAAGRDGAGEVGSGPDLVVFPADDEDLTADPLDRDGCTGGGLGMPQQTLLIEPAKGRGRRDRLPVVVEGHERQGNVLEGPVRRHPLGPSVSAGIDPGPHHGGRGEGDDGIDPSVVDGREERRLCAEGRSENGQAVTVRSQVVEGLGEGLQRHLERLRLLALPTEPPDGRGHRAEPTEQAGPFGVDPPAGAGKDEHPGPSKLLRHHEQPVGTGQPLLCDHVRLRCPTSSAQDRSDSPDSASKMWASLGSGATWITSPTFRWERLSRRTVTRCLSGVADSSSTSELGVP